MMFFHAFEQICTLTPVQICDIKVIRRGTTSSATHYPFTKGGGTMSAKLKVVLTLVEVAATAILIAVPAVRSIDSKIEAAKIEIALIRKEED